MAAAAVSDATAAAAVGWTCEATLKGAEQPFVAVLFAVDAAVAVFRATPAHTLLKAECVAFFLRALVCGLAMKRCKRETKESERERERERERETDRQRESEREREPSDRDTCTMRVLQ